MQKFLQTIIKHAGDEILKKYTKIGVKYTKENIGDVVTEADLLSNRLLLSAIKQRYPAHGVISEETGEYQAEAEYVWIIDPLDGTANFATSTPFWGVMVGLCRRGAMLMGAVYDPVAGDLTIAEKGKGAYKNGKKIRCSAKKDFAYSYGCGGARFRPVNLPFRRKFLRAAKTAEFHLNTFGACAISAMYTSDGRRDWFVSRGAQIWDYAAPSIILSEAGCKVANIHGTPWRPGDKGMIAANKFLFPKLVKMFKE